MKKESLNLNEVRSSVREQNNFVVEKLDFSELLSVKGGKDKTKDPSQDGYGGGLFCCL